MISEITTFRGWKLKYDTEGPRMLLSGPDEEWDSISAHERVFHRPYTTAELIMKSLTYIQKVELAKARDRSEIAMAQDIASAFIADNLLEGGR